MKVATSFLSKYNNITSKTDFFTSNRKSALAHFRRLFLEAIKEIEKGNEVLLIEATDSTGVLRCFDVDMMVKEGDKIRLIDITRTGYTISAEIQSIMDSKLEKLKHDFPNEKFLHEVRRFIFQENPNINVDYIIEGINSPMRSELLSVDALATEVRKLSKPQIHEIIHDEKILKNLSKTFGKPDFVRNININSENYPREGDEIMCSTNSSDSAAAYKARFSELPVELQIELCYDKFLELEKVDSKWVTPYSPLHYLNDDKLHDDLLHEVFQALDPSDDEILSNLKKLVLTGSSERMRKVNRVGKKGADMGYVFEYDKLGKRLSDEIYPLKPEVAKKCDFTTIEQDELDFLQNVEHLGVKQKSNNSIKLSMLVSQVLAYTDSVTTLNRKLLMGSIGSLMTTGLGSLFSTIQSASIAITSTMKLFKGYRREKGKSYFSLQHIKGHEGFIFTNITEDYQDNIDHSCIIIGNFLPMPNSFVCRETISNRTKWFNQGPENLDWQVSIYYRFLSYGSMVYDHGRVNRLEDSAFDLSRALSSSMFLLVNSSNFSQVAEQVRYIAINSVSTSNGCRELYNKVDWYSPKSKLEKLYLMRCIKMSSSVEWFGESGMKKKLIYNPRSLASDKVFSDWMIAFPHEQECIASELMFYNNMYICKMLSLKRYNRVMEESQIFVKQIQNRNKFLNPKLNAFSLQNCLDKDLGWCLSQLRRKTFCSGDNHAVSKPMMAFNMLVNVYQLMSDDTPLYEKRDRWGDKTDSFNLFECLDKMSLESVMSSKSSVSEVAGSGLLRNRVEISRNNRGEKIEERIAQNEKAYMSVLRNKSNFLRRIHTEFDEAAGFDCRVEKEIVDLKNVTTSALNLTSIWLDNIAYKKAAIASMFPKEGISTREIAVLNSNIKIYAKVIETLSIKFKDADQRRGDFTDIIAHKDKNTIVEKNYREREDSSYSVVYDNADCSKWGPTQDAYMLYASLAIRLNEDFIRSAVLESFSNFSTKVIKFPDEMLRSMDSSEISVVPYNTVEEALESLEVENRRKISESEVMAVRRFIKTCKNLGDKRYVNMDGNFMYASEGMFQGVFNECSSLNGSDVLRTIKHIMTECFRSRGLEIKVKQHCTSDDYSRIMHYKALDDCSYLNENGNLEHKRIAGDIISMTYYCQLSLGIKRNIWKSTMSQYIFELNSLFYSPRGTFSPDIKSRLSYIQYSESFDLFESSIRCLSVAQEYLRNEGSVVGALSVYLINCLMFIEQHSLSKLLYSMKICEVPLEVGGIARYNPLLHSTLPTHMILAENYTPDDIEKNSYNCMSYFLNYQADENADIILEDESGKETKMKMGKHSGVIKLVSRPDVTTRRMREMMELIDMDTLKVSNFATRSMIYEMFCSIQREEAKPSKQIPERKKCVIPMTPKNAKVYKAFSPFWIDILGSEKLSRGELDIIRVNYSEKLKPDRISLSETSEFFLSIYDHSKVDLQHGILVESIYSISITKDEKIINPTMKNVAKYCFEMFLADEVDINLYFREKMLKMESINSKEYLDGAMSIMSMEAKLKKLSREKKYFRSSTSSSEDNIVHVLLRSNYVEGGSLSYSSSISPTRGMRNTEYLKTQSKVADVMRTKTQGQEFISFHSNSYKLGLPDFTPLVRDIFSQSLTLRVKAQTVFQTATILSNGGFNFKTRFNRENIDSGMSSKKVKLPNGTQLEQVFSYDNNGLLKQVALGISLRNGKWRWFITRFDFEEDEFAYPSKIGDEIHHANVNIDSTYEIIDNFGMIFLMKDQVPVIYLCQSSRTFNHTIRFSAKKSQFITHSDSEYLLTCIKDEAFMDLIIPDRTDNRVVLIDEEDEDFYEFTKGNVDDGEIVDDEFLFGFLEEQEDRIEDDASIASEIRTVESTSYKTVLDSAVRFKSDKKKNTYEVEIQVPFDVGINDFEGDSKSSAVSKFLKYVEENRDEDSESLLNLVASGLASITALEVYF